MIFVNIFAYAEGFTNCKRIDVTKNKDCQDLLCTKTEEVFTDGMTFTVNVTVL